MLYIGIDYGAGDTNTECICEHHVDDTVTILEVNQWKHEIDLTPNADDWPGYASLPLLKPT